MAIKRGVVEAATIGGVVLALVGAIFAGQAIAASNTQPSDTSVVVEKETATPKPTATPTPTPTVAPVAEVPAPVIEAPAVEPAPEPVYEEPAAPDYGMPVPWVVIDDPNLVGGGYYDTTQCPSSSGYTAPDGNQYCS